LTAREVWGEDYILFCKTAAAHANVYFGGVTEKSKALAESIWSQLAKGRTAEGMRLTMKELRSKTLDDLNQQIASAPERPKMIRYMREEPLRALDQTIDVIKSHGAEIGVMTFGRQFVRPILRDRPGIRAEVQSLELAPHNESTLATALNAVVQFVREKETAGVNTDCPEKLARALLGNAHLAPEVEIRGISETPVLVGNEIRATRGFDEQLRMWINAPAVILPELLDKEAARSALKRLKSWLSEFAFVSDLDISVALSGMLTAALRASLAHAPGFLVSKPSYGAGASTLCEFWHIILTGRRVAVINATRDSEELTKQIDGVQLAGRAAIVIDNLADGAEFRSIPVAQTLSQPSREIRPLGRSTMADTPCTQMVMVNGCNPRLAADLVRRFLVCEIDPLMESPEEKVFKRPNLLEDAQRERVSLLTDCFTVVAAYLRCEDKAAIHLQPLAGFTDWARLVQGPLIWLGEPDPVQSRSKIVADDPAKSQLIRLFRSWYGLNGSSPVTAAMVLDALGGDHHESTDETIGRTAEEPLAREAARKELEQVIDEIGRDKAGKASTKTLGYYLRGKKGRIANGLRLEVCGETREGTTTYRVVPVCVARPKTDDTSQEAGNTMDSTPGNRDTELNWLDEAEIPRDLLMRELGADVCNHADALERDMISTV